MNTIHASSSAQAETDEPLWLEFPALRRSFRRGSRAKVLQENERRAPGHVPAYLHEARVRLDLPFGALEHATWTFRYLQAASYRHRASEVRAELRRHQAVYARAVAGGIYDRASEIIGPAVVESIRELTTRAKWYEGRAGAQLPRFDTVRSCGTAVINIACRVCAEPASDKPIPCRCGVARVCDACAEAADEKRRVRFAQARERAILEAEREGLFYGGRLSPDGRFVGAFSEKMLTLTVPHFTREQCEEVFKKNGDRAKDVLSETMGAHLENTTAARVAALRLAWPKFWRIVKRWLKARDPLGARHLAYYRFWEWTRGHDGKGHPHFHVYLFSPWLSAPMMRRAWVRALRAVGVVSFPQSCKQCRAEDDPDALSMPIDSGCHFGRGRDHVILDVRRLDGFNANALRELIKQGDRRLVEERLGTLRGRDDGNAVIEYAGGWSFADAFDPDDEHSVEVQRDLYIATENRRLCQGARGFLLPLPELVCECCGASLWSAGVARPFEMCHASSAEEPKEERGPPRGIEEETNQEELTFARPLAG